MKNFIGATGFCCLLFLANGVWSDDATVPGLAVGESTLSFTVVDVTGQYKGKRTCYVCEFQDDPNVIGFFQHTGDDTADMIVQLNKYYQANKDKNFKAVVVLIAGMDAKPWLEELSTSANIEIPMVVLRKGPNDLAVRMYHLNPEVENIFLVNINRSVVANISGIGTNEFQMVANAATEMLAQN